MKRTIPLVITAVGGFVLIVSFFIPAYQEWGEAAAVWFDILASIAFILGGGNLLKLHLKKMSDKQAGWGYSLITVIAFVTTLAFGLLKLGAGPAGNVEFYGESFARLAISELPVYTVPGTIPDRRDGEPLPAAARTQLREENGNLVFLGWMERNQRDDLLAYDDTLAWRCTVETLYAAAQPPDDLKGKIAYYPTHQALAVGGYVSAEDEQNLRGLFSDSDAAQSAIDTLVEQARESHTLPVTDVPASFAIPESASEYVSLTDGTLTIRGPMSLNLRSPNQPRSLTLSQLASDWVGFEKARPLTPVLRADLLRELENRGSPLTESQQDAFDTFFAADWTAAQLIDAANAGGVPVPEEKTACELLDEMMAGTGELTAEKPVGEEVQLNDDQTALIRAFAATPEQAYEELRSQLEAAGELTAGQAKAIETFLQKQPTRAEQMQKLGFELLQTGPLTGDQRDFLLAGIAREFAWRQQIGRLFQTAHTVKFPWSGDYTEQGTPFWWVYEYIFQPLLTTTFAMLAFYVASAAFRAFRAKNLEATLLLGTAFIILLGRTFAGYYVTAWVPESFSALRIDQMTIYIMGIFNTAGNRAIMIGIALGIASTSLKVLLGIDRSYLGSGDD